jgi:hypothetical protein
MNHLFSDLFMKVFSLISFILSSSSRRSAVAVSPYIPIKVYDVVLESLIDYQLAHLGVTIERRSAGPLTTANFNLRVSGAGMASMLKSASALFSLG